MPICQGIFAIFWLQRFRKKNREHNSDNNKNKCKQSENKLRFCKVSKALAVTAAESDYKEHNKTDNRKSEKEAMTYV